MRRAFLASSLALLASAAIPADEIKSLPGWTDALPSKQYSGLVNIDASTGKYMHYWFVECETNPAAAPVMLWLNGGPGCSSLDGYMYEQGPFHVDEADHTKLLYNPYTWAKQVNIIFLESPAGVGFSYSETVSDYTTNDTQTANDNFQFLVEFFKAYPEYANNDFYLAGESYAGIYVPTLAARVTLGNKKGESNIKLQGLMVGNGCTGNDTGICGGSDAQLLEKEFLFWHGLVSIDLSNKLDAACGDYANPDAKCRSLLSEMSNAIGDVNIYDIYDECINGATSSPRNRIPNRNLGGPDGCIDGIAAEAYLNTLPVQQAINVASARQYYGTWSICTGKIRYTSTASNLPKNVYPALASQYRVLIYNGDVDACVPYNDNEIWTSGMGYPVTNAWHAWSINDQVAGYATVYSVPGGKYPFTFITVKGSGHMVPQYQPAAASAMLSRFLNGQGF